MQPNTIPPLPHWSKQGTTYTLFRASVGHLTIKPAGTDYSLSVQHDNNGTPSGKPAILATGSPEFLVLRAQQLFTSEFDQPVTHNTFQ